VDDLGNTDLDDTILTEGSSRRASGRAVDDDTIVRNRTSAAAALHGRPALVEPPSQWTQEAGLRDARLLQAQSFSFRVNTHAPIPLDVPAFVGRRPILPRVPGVVAPRLVRVPSPLQEVSGTHLEVSQQGSSVVVTDLKSTNGTIVRMPGVPPLKLRQGESVVVLPGTLVDIGDGNVLEILPMRRLIAPAGAPGERFSQ
jgi:FHA domain